METRFLSIFPRHLYSSISFTKKWIARLFISFLLGICGAFFPFFRSVTFYFTAEETLIKSFYVNFTKTILSDGKYCFKFIRKNVYTNWEAPLVIQEKTYLPLTTRCTGRLVRASCVWKSLAVTWHSQLPSSNSSWAALTHMEQSPFSWLPEAHSYLCGYMPIGCKIIYETEQIQILHLGLGQTYIYRVFL